MTKELLIPLYVAQHHHRPEDCPAAPGRGTRLLSSVSAATAARYGVTIQAEAFLDQQHLLLLVVQAATLQAVHRFLARVPGSGRTQVLPACTAEEAVGRGGCGPARSTEGNTATITQPGQHPGDRGTRPGLGHASAQEQQKGTSP